LSAEALSAFTPAVVDAIETPLTAGVEGIIGVGPASGVDDIEMPLTAGPDVVGPGEVVDTIETPLTVGPDVVIAVGLRLPTNSQCTPMKPFNKPIHMD